LLIQVYIVDHDQREMRFAFKNRLDKFWKLQSCIYRQLDRNNQQKLDRNYS